MKNTYGAPLRGILFRNWLSATGTQEERDIRLRKMKATDEVRGGTPSVLVRNPLHGSAETERMDGCDRAGDEAGDQICRDISNGEAS